MAVSTERELQLSMSQDDAFNQLFQGFMGIGLIVGVAAIGVLSFRAVEERRQSIGCSVRSVSGRGWYSSSSSGSDVRNADRHHSRPRSRHDDLVEHLQ